jgi:XRE family transcriptional regulator, aerobic/anaerobic benzoate catabolism transcriptional regulator
MKIESLKDDVYLKKLGEKVSTVRKAKGMSQQVLAEKLNTKHPQIVRIEHGQVNSTINMLRHLAKALQVNVIDLIDVTKD